MYGQDSLIAGLKFCKHNCIRPFLDSWTALFLGWVWGRHENRPWGFRVTLKRCFSRKNLRPGWDQNFKSIRFFGEKIAAEVNWLHMLNHGRLNHMQTTE